MIMVRLWVSDDGCESTCMKTVLIHIIYEKHVDSIFQEYYFYLCNVKDKYKEQYKLISLKTVDSHARRMLAPVIILTCKHNLRLQHGEVIHDPGDVHHYLICQHCMDYFLRAVGHFKLRENRRKSKNNSWC